MPRVLRNSLPDGFFHVSARGVDRRTPLFRDSKDRNSFLRLFPTALERFDWTCHALCVMSTHYHLVLETTQPQLSHGLHWLNGAYARQFNRRHERFGHVFASRFDARVIETDEYLHDACEYVLQNPVRAGLCDSADQWPWSYSRYRLSTAA